MKELTNEERIVELVVDRKEGTTTLTLPIEDRISGSEKSVIVSGINGSMRVMVGKEEHVLACSLYKKNANYNAEEAKKRAEAKKTVRTGQYKAKLVS